LLLTFNNSLIVILCWKGTMRYHRCLPQNRGFRADESSATCDPKETRVPGAGQGMAALLYDGPNVVDEFACRRQTEFFCNVHRNHW